MAGFTRRRFVVLTGVVAGAALVSKTAVDRWPDDSTVEPQEDEREPSVTTVEDTVPPSRLDQLGIDGATVDEDVIAIGREVNLQSPASAERVAVLLDSGHSLDDILARPPARPPVVVEGWLLPDTTAGVAGLVAAEAGGA